MHAPLEMEEYTPHAEAPAPGGRSNPRSADQTQEGPRTPFGEMAQDNPNMSQDAFLDPDSRRQTFPDEGTIAQDPDRAAALVDSVFSSTVRPNVLNMTDPRHSAPGTDYLLAAEYIYGETAYYAGEVLEAGSFPELEQERNRRIAEFMRDFHQQDSTSRFVPRTLQTSRPSVGMTGDTRTREENLRQWREEIYDKHFIRHTGSDDHIQVKSERLTMPDGRVYKRGQLLEKKTATLYIESSIRDTTRAERSRRLSGPLPASAASGSPIPYDPPRRPDPRASVRLEPADIADQMSVLSDGSQQRRVDGPLPGSLPITPDPKDRTRPMRSPVQIHDYEWILRVEMRSTRLDRSALPQPLDVSAFYNHSVVEAGTRIDKKTPFIRSPTNRYPYKSVSAHAYRIMLTELVAHWTRGPTSDPNVYLYSCWDPAFQADFIRRWRAQCSAAVSHPHRQDGRYIQTYHNYNAAQFGSLSAIDILFLLYICLLPPRKGLEGRPEECMVPAVKEVVADELSYLVERFSAYMKNGILDFMGNYMIVTEAIFAAMAEIEYTISVYEWWMNVGWFDVAPPRDGANKSHCFAYILDGLLVKASTPEFDLYGLWHHWTPAVQTKSRSRQHVSTYIATKRMAQQSEKSIFEPLHGHLPALLNLPKPPHSMRGSLSHAEEVRGEPKPSATTRTPTASRSFTLAKQPPTDKARFNNIVTTMDNSDDETEPESVPSDKLASDQTPSPPATVPPDLSSPDVIARLAALVSSHMKAEAARPTVATPMKSTYTPSSPSPWTSPVSPAEPSEKIPLDKRACYNILVAGKCSRSDNDCNYSHDPKIVNEAKTQCMARWRANQRTPFNNLSILDRFFPKQSGVDDPSGYSDASREAVYEYFDSKVSATANSDY